MFSSASKRSCLRRPFGNQRVNGFETLLMSARHHYFPLFPILRDILNWKKSALVTSEIFRLFVNTLTPDDKYSRRNMMIFWQQVQTPLSQKGKTFLSLLFAFLKCPWNLAFLKCYCMKFRTFGNQKKKSTRQLSSFSTPKFSISHEMFIALTSDERDIYLSV